MALLETSANFCKRFKADLSLQDDFSVYRIEDFRKATPLPHYRRNFYKISLLTSGNGIISYADRQYIVDVPVLTFSNPIIPYSWEPLTANESGYFCLFKEEFVAA